MGTHAKIDTLHCTHIKETSFTRFVQFLTRLGQKRILSFPQGGSSFPFIHVLMCVFEMQKTFCIAQPYNILVFIQFSLFNIILREIASENDFKVDAATGGHFGSRPLLGSAMGRCGSPTQGS